MDFTLRPWSLNDLESLVRYANNEKIAKFMTGQFPFPYTPAHGKGFIGMASGMQPVRIFAIDVNGAAVGGIGIHPQTDIQSRNAELGYWLGEPFWGKGIMTRAVVQMTDTGFSNPEINRIFARPFGSNTASQKVLEKAGFSFEARFEKTLFKNGAFEDELYYAIRRK